MKIGIVGGGNLGSVLAVRFSKNHKVMVYKRDKAKLHLFKKDMKVFCEDSGSFYIGNIFKFTSELKELVDFADYIFITYPAFLFKELSIEMIPLLSQGKHLVFVPGSGAVEIFFKDALKKE